jgi:ribosomal protein L7/L12
MSTSFDCPACGASIDSTARTCPYCGTAIKAGSAPVPPSTQLDQDLFNGQIGLNASEADQFSAVRAEIRRGNKLEAIKIYRQLTGVSLAEAKSAVEALAAGQPVVVSQATLVSGMGGADKATLLEEVDDQIRQGNKIAAIKAYREMTGVGLAEAKAAVEAMAAGQPVSSADAALISASAAAGAGFASSAEAMDAIKAELRAGKKIEAIKIHRAYFDTGLAEAKTAVEQIENDLQFQPAPLADTEPPAFARPVAPVEPTMGANPFDEPQAPAWRKWLIGCSIGAVLFLCLCVVLPTALFFMGIVKLSK